MPATLVIRFSGHCLVQLATDILILVGEEDSMMPAASALCIVWYAMVRSREGTFQ